MTAHIARRPFTFRGRPYAQGQEFDASTATPYELDRLLRRGRIAPPAPEAPAAPWHDAKTHKKMDAVAAGLLGDEFPDGWADMNLNEKRDALDGLVLS